MSSTSCPPQERPAPGIPPRADAARRSGDPRGGQALSRDAGDPARHRDGLGRGSPVAHPPPDRQSRGGAAGERRGAGQDRVSGVPLAPGEGSSAPLRLPREDVLWKVNGAWKLGKGTIVLGANVLLDKNLSVFL